MPYRVELPKNIRNFETKTGSLSLTKIAGESGDGGDDPTEGEIIAVEICSNILEDHIWLASDRSIDPKDGKAIYYPEELPFLTAKDIETLKEIHKVKLTFPGSKVRW